MFYIRTQTQLWFAKLTMTQWSVRTTVCPIGLSQSMVASARATTLDVLPLSTYANKNWSPKNSLQNVMSIHLLRRLVGFKYKCPKRARRDSLPKAWYFLARPKLDPARSVVCPCMGRHPSTFLFSAHRAARPSMRRNRLTR